MARKLLFLAGGIVALFLLILLLVPVFVDVNSYRPRIESMMTTALGRKVALGNIKLSILSGGVAVNDVAILDDPAFETGDFVKAKSVTVGVELMPLIFSHALNVTGITIEEPEVTLLRSATGHWNVESIGASSPAAPASRPAAPANPPSSSSAAGSATGISVARLRIHNGKLIVGDAGAKGKTHEYDQVNLDASDLSYTTQFPFTFSAQTPGNGSIKLNGKAGPLNQADMQATPMEASLEIRGLDLNAAGLVEPASGVAGKLDFTGSVSGDGKQIHSTGAITASRMQLVPGSAPAGEPVVLNYDTTYQPQPQTGSLTQCDVHIGKAVAHLTGTYRTAGASPSVQLKLTADAMPLADLQTVMPAVGVALPAGTSIKEGTLTANLTISGPVDKLLIVGPVNAFNARLAGFDLAQKMGALASFAGVPKGSDTVIQTFSTDVRVAPEGTKADKINVVAQGIGNLQGAGTVAADHALDFKMTAELTGSASPMVGISKLAGAGQKGKGGLPFLIKGTTSDPQFLPDMAGFAGGLGKGVVSGGAGLAGGAGNLGSSVGGLFGKKK